MLQPHIPTREPPGPLRIVTSPPFNHNSGSSPQGGGSSAEAHDVNVLSRLHALFHSSHSTTSEDAVQGMARVRSEPVPHGAGLEEMISPSTFEDRKAIKVLVITWNMGDALVSPSRDPNRGAMLRLDIAAQRRFVGSVWSCAAVHGFWRPRLTSPSACGRCTPLPPCRGSRTGMSNAFWSPERVGRRDHERRTCDAQKGQGGEAKATG
jgi:hypothetical protein